MRLAILLAVILSLPLAHAALAGDVNGDGRVDLQDLLAVLQHVGRTKAYQESVDLNADGAVNLFDIVTVTRDWGKSTPPVAGDGQPVFFDDFESGDRLHTENGYAWRPSTQTNLAVETTKSVSGQYSLRFLFPAKPDCQDSTTEQRLTFGDQLQEIWLEYHLYVPDGSEGGAPFHHRSQSNLNCSSLSTGNKFIRIWGDESTYNDNDPKLGISFDAAGITGDSNLYVQWGDGDNTMLGPQDPQSRWFPWVSESDPGAVRRGDWVHIRLHGKLATAPSATDGEIQLWANGDLKVNLTGKNFYGVDNPSYFKTMYLLGWSNSGYNEDTYFYIDDVAIYNSDPGWTAPQAPTDTVAPVLSNGSPVGQLSSGTTSTLIEVSTDESATCKYSTTPAQSYDTIQNTFSITGGTHSATVSGLSDGQSYTYFVRCQDAAGNSNTDDFLINFTIAAPGPLVTLTTNEPNWPLQVIGWDLDKAYPGLPYEHRISVIGGKYPYTFALTQAPSGMTISSSGTISWTPAQPISTTVSVLVTDSIGQTATRTFSLDASTSGVYFASPSGSDTASGSITQPFRTITHANSVAGIGALVYVRSGTYVERFWINQNSPAAFLAYPGELPVIDGTGGSNIIAVSNAHNRMVQGFEIRNSGNRIFDMGATHNFTIRKNHMHTINSTGAGNAGMLFTADGSTTPVEGAPPRYLNIIFQENECHNLRNDQNHAGCVIFYDVMQGLVEDNIAYDIDGRCFGDKDDGYFNTIRGNTCSDSHAGIRLENQGTQAQIDVHHNLIHGIRDAVVVGWQPGYIRDVFVHHNTIDGGHMKVRAYTLNSPGGNINFYRNIVVNSPAHLYDAADGGSSAIVLAGNKVKYDGNLIYTSGSHVFSGDYGGVRKTFAEWQALGFDTNGVLADPQLDSNHNLPAGSVYRGIHGRE